MDAPPSAQQERTALAWRRSALSFFAVGVLIFREALRDGAPLVAGISGIATLIAMWLALLSSHSDRRRITSHAGTRYTVLRDGQLPAILFGVAVALSLTVAGSAAGLTG